MLEISQHDIAVGDFNRDSNPDIANTNSVSNTVSVLMGNRGGTFESAVFYSVGANPDRSCSKRF